MRDPRKTRKARKKKGKRWIKTEKMEKTEKMDEEGKDGKYRDRGAENEWFEVRGGNFCHQGAVFEVYRVMGCGFLEAVYQECLEKELAARGILFVAQQELRLYYKGETLRQFYKPDLICFGKIIVELKAISALSGEHKAQVLNYLKATGHEVGLLVNFGCYPKAIVERLVL